MPPPHDAVSPAEAHSRGRRPGRRSAAESDATRVRILRQAGELFLRQGFSGTTVREIADAADLTVPAIYHHFAGKQALLDAILAPVLDGMDEVLPIARQRPVDRAALLADVVDVLTREGPPVERLLADPSVFSLPAVGGRVRAQTDRLTDLLSPPDASPRTRVLVGAAVAALLAAARDVGAHTPGGPSAQDRQWAIDAALALLALAEGAR